MGYSEKVVIPEEVPRKERRVKGKDFAREIQWEKMRKALVVVVEALEPKKKGEALVETGKGAMAVDKIQSVEALLEALVALVETGKDVDKKQTERSDAVAVETDDSATDDEWEYIGDKYFDDESGEVDEEVLKQITEVQEYVKQTWIDCVQHALRAGVQFGDPSLPYGCSAGDIPPEDLITLSS
ncbi:unnamed protein product [Alopecurus aequalis]